MPSSMPSLRTMKSLVYSRKATAMVPTAMQKLATPTITEPLESFGSLDMSKGGALGGARCRT